MEKTELQSGQLRRESEHWEEEERRVFGFYGNTLRSRTFRNLPDGEARRRRIRGTIWNGDLVRWVTHVDGTAAVQGDSCIDASAAGRRARPPSLSLHAPPSPPSLFFPICCMQLLLLMLHSFLPTLSSRTILLHAASNTLNIFWKGEKVRILHMWCGSREKETGHALSNQTEAARWKNENVFNGTKNDEQHKTRSF